MFITLITVDSLSRLLLYLWFVHTAATMIAICQLRIDSVFYERFRELALECSYPHHSHAVMGINRKLHSE